MSYHTLQRLIVRMLFDPQFVDQVYQEPDLAFANLDLTTTERAQLLNVDRRAWQYDPLRRLRTLRILVEEFKASTTLALADRRELAFLDSYFSSTTFHNAIQQRGSMGLAFAEFLAQSITHGRLKIAQLPDVLRLETLLARARRALLRARGQAHAPVAGTLSDQTRVKLAAGNDVGSFQGNTVACVQRVEQYLFEVSMMPAMVLCSDAPQLTDLPAVDSRNKIYLQTIPAANGVTLVNIEKADYLVLLEARAAITIRQLITRAHSNGVKSELATGIITDALEQQTLVIS